MTARPAVESVDRRLTPRYRGKPVRHRLRCTCHDSDVRWPRGYFTLDCAARICDFAITIDGGYTAAEVARFTRQHAGKP